MFLITHDLDTLYEICDRVAVLADKKVIAVGTIPELLANGASVDPGIFQRPARPGRQGKSAAEQAAWTRTAIRGIRYRRMETRANHVWVGAVTLLLLAALAAFIIWLARLNAGDQKEYDIFFKQSVDGLAKGSAVTFSGVPVGQVTEIELWPTDPEFVRVRITLNKTVPILHRHARRRSRRSFTGVSKIQLDGARRRCAADHLRRRPPAPKACR